MEGTFSTAKIGLGVKIIVSILLKIFFFIFCLSISILHHCEYGITVLYTFFFAYDNLVSIDTRILIYLCVHILIYYTNRIYNLKIHTKYICFCVHTSRSFSIYKTLHHHQAFEARSTPKNTTPFAGIDQIEWL